MLKYLNSKLSRVIEKNSKEKNVKSSIDNSDYKPKNDIIKYEENEDFANLQILEECTFEEYIEQINSYKVKNKIIEIPIRMFITTGGNLLNTKLKKQIISFMSSNNIECIFVNGENEIIISQRIKLADEIIEITIKLEKLTGQYTIAKYVHDLNYSTKLCKWYPVKGDYLEFFTLTKNEALELFKIFIKNLESIFDNKMFPDIEDIYRSIELIKSSIMNDNEGKLIDEESEQPQEMLPQPISTSPDFPSLKKIFDNKN